DLVGHLVAHSQGIGRAWSLPLAKPLSKVTSVSRAQTPKSDPKSRDDLTLKCELFIVM
ncbi:unnamed protein product, partial [Sphenostylis stenocarpa]